MSHQVCFTFEIYPLIIGQSKKVKNETLKYSSWEKVFCDSDHVTTFRIVLEKSAISSIIKILHSEFVVKMYKLMFQNQPHLRETCFSNSAIFPCLSFLTEINLSLSKCLWSCKVFTVCPNCNTAQWYFIAGHNALSMAIIIAAITALWEMPVIVAHLLLH